MSNKIVRLTIIDKKEHLLNFKLEYINTKLFFTCTANNTETSLLKKKQYQQGVIWRVYLRRIYITYQLWDKQVKEVATAHAKSNRCIKQELLILQQ